MKRIIYDYENPHIVGKASKSFPLAKVIVAVILIALAVALIYIIFFRKTAYALESKEYFSVISGEYDNQGEAEIAAEQIKNMGGGGYIVKDGKYEVVVSIYKDIADAEIVAKRYDYKIQSLGKYNFGVSYADAAVSKKTSELILFPERLFDELYNTLISLDKGDISEDAAMYSLEQLCAIFVGKTETLKELQAKTSSDKLLDEADKMYSEIAASLSKAKLVNGAASASSRLKYCLIEITYIYKNFLIAIT